MLNLFYITTSDKAEAKEIGGTLVKENLVACANVIDGMESVFPWEGTIDSDQETVLIVKTHEDRNDEVMKRIQELHSYDCPCILVLPIKTGNQAFIDWVKEEVGVKEKEA